jgi:hypothetical protein
MCGTLRLHRVASTTAEARAGVLCAQHSICRAGVTRHLTRNRLRGSASSGIPPLDGLDLVEKFAQYHRRVDACYTALI